MIGIVSGTRSPSTITQVVLPSNVAAVLGHAPQLQQHDVVAGEYEGGFKLWEGGVDLAAHAAAAWGVTNTPSRALALTNQRVLELGCGAGLPGVVAMLAGADVLFQVPCSNDCGQHTALHGTMRYIGSIHTMAAHHSTTTPLAGLQPPSVATCYDAQRARQRRRCHRPPLCSRLLVNAACLAGCTASTGRL